MIRPRYFLDHGDLHIEIERRAEVQQIAANDDEFILPGALQQPVELFQREMQVSQEKETHGDSLRLRQERGVFPR